jgi:WD40 repeat protein
MALPLGLNLSIMLIRLCRLFFVAQTLTWASAANSEQLEYGRDIKPILTKFCVGCHNPTDHESDVQLQSLVAIKKGGTMGTILQPKDPDGSLMVQLILGTQEPKMPPEDAPQPSSQEIEIVRRWVLEGANGSDEAIPLKSRLQVKPIEVSKEIAAPITATGLLPNQSLLLGRTNAVYVKNSQWSERLPIEVVGKVTQIRSTSDGRFTVIASGIPGVGGQATILENVQSAIDGSLTRLVRTIEGHNDTLYTAVLSPDGKLLATGSYDRVIILWEVATGQPIRTLKGHNGAIYDLDFDETGVVIASASADETIKIWRVDDGQRLDTLGQGEAEQVSVRFDSPRSRVLAIGADKRIRAWRLLSLDKPTVSPMLYSTFAHEAPVTQMTMTNNGRFLATAGEDKQVKLWRAEDLSPLGQLAALDDAPSGLLWDASQTKLIASTLTGHLLNIDASKWMALEESGSHSLPDQNTIPIRFVSKPTISKIQEQPLKRTVHNPMPISTDSEIEAVLSTTDMQGEQAGDWYSFYAKANEAWIIRVQAKESPIDSLLDVLDADGQPLLRSRLQAVRETYFTFRGNDSRNSDDFRLHRWEDMELNEFLYAGGEVVKLWLYPRGPDSGFRLYPGFGKRFTYFDTTASTHALNEPGWIVRELGVQESPVPNGLPVFPIYYSNDDDSNRIDGVNSKLSFTPKQDGQYLIRVRDTRGQSGDNYKYTLTLLAPQPRFQVRFEQADITLRQSSGTEFSLVADRFEGCDGDIQIQLEGLPEGFQVTQPLTIQAGQHKAVGTIHSPGNLSSMPNEWKMTATCTSATGSPRDDAKPELTIKINDKPTMPLKLVAMGQDVGGEPLQELVIRPGTTVSAKLVIDRGGNLGDIAFGGDDSGRNLPHGCYVDNIGLSGLLIPADQSIREVFFTAAPWVAEQTRPFHLRALVDGNPTTSVIQIRVVK